MKSLYALAGVGPDYGKAYLSEMHCVTDWSCQVGLTIAASLGQISLQFYAKRKSNFIDFLKRGLPCTELVPSRK
jgi:hypothetical protein